MLLIEGGQTSNFQSIIIAGNACNALSTCAPPPKCLYCISMLTTHQHVHPHPSLPSPCMHITLFCLSAYTSASCHIPTCKHQSSCAISAQYFRICVLVFYKCGLAALKLPCFPEPRSSGAPSPPSQPHSMILPLSPLSLPIVTPLHPHVSHIKGFQRIKYLSCYRHHPFLPLPIPTPRISMYNIPISPNIPPD